MEALIQEFQSDVSTSIAQKARLLRLWVMFDRDSAPSDRSQPSSNSERIKALCEDSAQSAKWPWPLSYYQLGRRSIENYLPELALRFWQAKASGNKMTKRRESVDALCDLRKSNPVAARQLNMKHGLLGDLEPPPLRRQIREQKRDVREQDLDPLFKNLSVSQLRALRDGFGTRIAEELANDYQGLETAFRTEFERDRGHAQESREAILDSLFRRL